MNISISITQHELRQMFASRKVWYSLAMLQALLAVIFNWLLTNFLTLQTSSKGLHNGITEEVLHPFYACFGLIVLLVLPMFAAQTICAEKQQGTMLNYYCAPINLSKVILGKFLSGSIILLLALAWITCMPLIVISPKLLDSGQLLAIVGGTYLMLNAALAICLGLAPYLESVQRANIILLLFLLAAILLEWAAHYLGPYRIYLQMFSLLFPLKAFLAGIINLRAIAIYLLMIISFLTLGSVRLEKRHLYV